MTVATTVEIEFIIKINNNNKTVEKISSLVLSFIRCDGDGGDEDAVDELISGAGNKHHNMVLVIMLCGFYVILVMI